MWPFKRDRLVEEVLDASLGRRADERTSSPLIALSNPAVAEYLGFGLTSYSGVAVNEVSALGMSAVYRAVCVIADTLGSMPLQSVRTDPASGERKVVPSFLDNPAGPDSYVPTTWKRLVLIHLLVHGNAYMIHRYNAVGVLVGLDPVHPLSVNTEWDSSRPGGKKFTVNMIDGGVQDFDATTLTHVMDETLDGLVGMSTIAVARNSLGTGIAGDRAAARIFKNGALISGLVTPEEDLSDDDAKTIKADLRSKMLGEEFAGDVVVINRKLKFSPWTMSAADAQFLESRKFSIEEVARWFGVPPHLLMQTEKQTSWGTGVEEQNRGLRQMVLGPWATLLEEHLTRLIPRGQVAKFDFTILERSSPKDEADLLIKKVNAGLITPNEARRELNLPPVTGGDALRVPSSSTTPELPADDASSTNGDVVPLQEVS